MNINSLYNENRWKVDNIDVIKKRCWKCRRETIQILEWGTEAWFECQRCGHSRNYERKVNNG